MTQPKTKTLRRKPVETTWDVATYDVWGNSEDGYEVNDKRISRRDYSLGLKTKQYNAGTPQAFESLEVTDEQIREALNLDGDDVTIYVNRASDSYPLGELVCTSHDSLSPPDLKPQPFTYHINLDERGSFCADVRDANEKEVFTIKAGDELQPDESSIFDDGFMRHKEDVQGLRDYLVSLSIMRDKDTLKKA